MNYPNDFHSACCRAEINDVALDGRTSDPSGEVRAWPAQSGKPTQQFASSPNCPDDSLPRRWIPRAEVQADIGKIVIGIDG
jgi:hypothetical protein